MNIAHVRYFIAAAEKGSYSAAAASCFVTVQTISKAVIALENEAGSSLFNRTSTGVVLTEFGRSFYEKALRAEAVFAELEHAGSASSSSADEPEKLVVAVSHTLFRGSIVEAEDLLAFARTRPNLDLVLHGSSSAECVKAAEAHTVDAALVTGHVETTSLEVVEITRVEPALLMDPRHPLSKKARVSVEDLRDIPVATPPGLVDDYLPLIEACQARGFMPRFADVVPTLEAHRAFVHEALGVVIIIDGDWICTAYPGCVARPFAPYPAASVPLCLVFDPARATPSLESFRRYVISTVRHLARLREK